jgi:hypothetical protein
MSATPITTDEKLELARLRMLKDAVLAVVNAPVDNPSREQVKALRGAAAFVGWNTSRGFGLRDGPSLHRMQRSLYVLDEKL